MLLAFISRISYRMEENLEEGKTVKNWQVVVRLGLVLVIVEVARSVIVLYIILKAKQRHLLKN